MKSITLLVLSALILRFSSAQASGGRDLEPAYTALADGTTQYAAFPKPIETYVKVEGGLSETLKARVKADPFNLVASLIFLLAILHTFAAGPISKLAHH